MSLNFLSADDRRNEQLGVKALITGPSGIGKTSLIKTLDPETTLFVDLEAGDLAIAGHPVTSVRPRKWGECRDLAVMISGPNPDLPDDAPFSNAHYDHVLLQLGAENPFERFETIFVDSITVAGRLCFGWCKRQPEAMNAGGKPDLRGAYGLHGREMIAWLTHLQHARGKNVVFVGILEKREDDYGRTTWELQIDGSKVGRELPGIVDQVITMQSFPRENAEPYRALVCHTLNEWGYPAKDRSGRLDLLEKPHLGELFTKCRGERSKPQLAPINNNDEAA